MLLVGASGDPRDGLLGFRPELAAEIYDQATNRWALTAPMNVARVQRPSPFSTRAGAGAQLRGWEVAVQIVESSRRPRAFRPGGSVGNVFSGG